MACLETGKRQRMSRFTLGVNYWPRRSAMYMWERFDLGEIREDFARIRSLGLDVVRFFIMWDDFQPQAGRMDNEMLRRFDGVMDALAAAGLKGMPAFFTGHMSGVNFLPEWVLDTSRTQLRFRTFGRGMREYPWGAADFYSPPLLDACRLHVRSIGERCRAHEALYMWDLGNEFSNLRSANSPQEAANWSRVLTEDLFEVSGAATTAGNHSEDLTDDRGIRPSSFCKPFSCAVMHGYSVYADIARSRTDPEVVPFFCQLMQSMSGKTVLFNEFGNPTCPPNTVSPYDRQPLPGDPLPDEKDLPPNAAPYACLTEQEMATYCYEVLDRLQRRGALGAFWWNWADYATELAQTPPFDRAHHEMSFGMIRNDGSYKPVADVLRQFSQENRPVLPPPPAIVREDEWYANMNKAYHKAAYEHYLGAYANVQV
jgi:endo-1,4-beta-mannosidase